jgi:hypothetical protein
VLGRIKEDRVLIEFALRSLNRYRRRRAHDAVSFDAQKLRRGRQIRWQPHIDLENSRRSCFISRSFASMYERPSVAPLTERSHRRPSLLFDFFCVAHGQSPGWQAILSPPFDRTHVLCS